MHLSKTEKLILANQYEMLKILTPENAGEYDLLLSALYSGYERDFDDLLPSFPETIDGDVTTEVREILDMFRALGPRHDQNGRVEAEAHFIGFDGNEETEHFAYARFLLEKRGLWLESKPESYNTHSPVLPAYRKMLHEWSKAPKKFELSAEDIERIIAKAPYGSVSHRSS